MKKSILILAALAVSCTNFTFVHMSDPQIGFIDPSPVCAKTDSLMKLAAEKVNELKPELVFNTGDLINEPYNHLQDSIYRVRKADFHAPVWEVPGNHDVMGYSGESMANYLSLRGYNRFSFKKKGCTFIGIDSNCIKDDAADAEAEQLDWLQGQLKQASGSRFIFVFLHCPIIRESIDEPEDYFNFPVQKRRQYIDLFKSAGVSAVFAGHCHRTITCEYDGIRFYTAGPVGSPLGDGYSGFNLISVGRNGFEVEYIPTSQTTPKMH